MENSVSPDKTHRVIYLTHILSASDGLLRLNVPPDEVLSFTLEDDAVVVVFVQRGNGWRFDAGGFDPDTGMPIKGRWVEDSSIPPQKCVLRLGYDVVVG